MHSTKQVFVVYNLKLKSYESKVIKLWACVWIRGDTLITKEVFVVYNLKVKS